MEMEKKRMKVLFWNVFGIAKKEDSFWEYIRNFDVVGMLETWVEEKSWRKIEKKLPDEFRWKYQGAIREKGKGRARGGIITGVRKEIKEKAEKKPDTTNVMGRTLRIGQKTWKIVSIYSTGMKNLRKELEQKIDEIGEERVLIGGDFNARIGERGSTVQELENERKRPTKDKTVNSEGKLLIDLMEERGWDTLNGNKMGDENGEYTYVRGNVATTIDYAMASRRIRGNRDV